MLTCHIGRLQTWSGREGNIRLSIDDGPPAREFLDDDYDEDNEVVADDEPLALRADRLKGQHSPTPSSPHAPHVALDASHSPSL